MLIHTLLNTLDLQRQQSRVIPAQRHVATMEPEARVAAVLPYRAPLALFVETPDILDTIAEFIAVHVARLAAHVQVPRGKDNLVRLQGGAVGELQPVGENLGDLLALLDLDLAVGDELRRADVNVVAAAALEVLEEQAGAVRAVVELEAGLGEAVEDVLVVGALDGADLGLHGLEHGVGEAMEEQVGIVGRGRIFIEKALEGNLGDGLGGNDVGARTLDNSNVVARLVEVVRDIMARVAAAYHNCLLTLCILSRAGELGRMTEQMTLEVINALDIRKILLSRMSSRLDNMLGGKSPGFRGPIGFLALQHNSPLLGGLVPLRARELRRHPHVELHVLRVRLEPTAELVFGRKDGPVGWERHVRHVVVPDGVVEDQLVVPVAPVVANTLVLVNDEGVDAQHLQTNGCGKTSLTSA